MARFVIYLSLFLSGCGNSITPAHFHAAEKACSTQGGLDRMGLAISDKETGYVWCKNGSQFTGTPVEKQP